MKHSAGFPDTVQPCPIVKSLPILPCLLLFASLAIANDWPSWRGPTGDGKLPGAEGYPLEWSSGRNELWRVSLEFPGNSSPVVVRERLFLTFGRNDGRERVLQCRSIDDGSIMWEQAVSYGKRDTTHKTNPYSSASPLCDGERVYAWHGNAGLHAYDLDGKELWKSDLGNDYEHIWGPNAASPVLHGDTLIVHAGPGLAVRLFGIDRKTGETLWKKDLPEAVSEEVGQFKGSWATPLLIENGGRTEMLIGLPKFLVSFDPNSGEELWRCSGPSDLAYTNVLTGPERAVYLSGFGGPGMGVRLPEPTVKGDVTESHLLWAEEGKKPNRQRIGSGQMIGDHVYQLDEPGIMVCLDAKTGKRIWEERVSKRSWSSMNLIGSNLYVNDQLATTYIVEPDPSGLQLLHTNPLEGNLHTNSTPAFAGGRIFLRTDSHLFAFGGE